MGSEWFGTYVIIPKRYTKHGITAETFSNIREDVYFFVENILDLDKHYSLFGDYADPEDLCDWYLVSAIDDFTTATEAYGIAKVKDHFVYYTGGFSWGDEPTDCFTNFCVVSDLFYAMDKLNYKGRNKYRGR